MPTSWIQPTQNSFMETFGQVQQLKAQHAQNALYAAKAAELPYERERAEKLNEANIGKATAQTEQAQAATQGSELENTFKKMDLGVRILSQARDEGSYQWAKKRAVAEGLPIDDLPEHFDPAFVEHRLQSGMELKDKIAAQLNERKFTHTQEQAAIDNQFQQGNLDVARTNAATSQAGLEERRAYHQGMLNKPDAGLSLGYDEQGRVILGQGGKLTEGQSKATVNAAGAEVGNTELSDLKAEGFDPTSASGGLNTWAAGKPGLNLLASEEGQRQHAANTGFAQAVNYQRSGAATPEVEYLRAVDSMMDRYGDKPAATDYKKRMRDSLIQAVRAGGGASVDQIVGQILTNNRATGGGAGSVSNRTQTAAPAQQPPGGEDPRAKLERLRALKAASGG